jgi:hypothetical protein
VAYIAPSLTEDQKYILEKIKLGEYLSAEEIQEVRSVDDLFGCHLTIWSASELMVLVATSHMDNGMVHAPWER